MTAPFRTAYAAGFLPTGTPPELISDIENAARDALIEHGPSAFTTSREAALVHEAGHAVVGAHEGLAIRGVSIFSRHTPSGELWTGWCAVDDPAWTTGPKTSAESDLRTARIIIAGLAAEALCKLDKAGSSLDELVVSQVVGCNAAAKLADPALSDGPEYGAYCERLWHDQVWGVTLAILRANREPFVQLVELLHKREQITGGKLRRLLARVRRHAP